MVSRNEERYATGVTGAGLVAGGSVLRGKGIDQAHHLVGKPEPKIGPIKIKAGQLLRTRAKGSGKARALYGAGTLAMLAGGTAVGAAATNQLPSRRREPPPNLWHRVFKADESSHTFLGSGLQGTKDALTSRGKNVREKKPAKTYAVSYGPGALSALGASKLAHVAFDRKAIGSKLRRPTTALAATAAAVATTPVTNKIMDRVTPGYQLTAAGVKRKKTAPMRPSAKASIHEGRVRHGGDPRAFRSDIVGKGYVWSQAADDLPSHRSQFFSMDPLSVKEGKTFGRKGKRVAVHAHEPEPSRPGIRRGGAMYQGEIPLRHGKTWAKDTQHWMQLAHEEAGHTGQISNVERDLLRARRRYIGSRVGGGLALVGAGAYANSKLRKSMPDMADLHVPGGNIVLKKRKKPVSKFGGPSAPGMDREQTLHQIKAKRRKLMTDTATTGLGLAGGALLVAPRLHRLAPHAEKIERAAFKTAVGSGVVGSVAGVQGIKIQRRDLKAQQKALKINKRDNDHTGRNIGLGAGAVGVAGGAKVKRLMRTQTHIKDGIEYASHRAFVRSTPHPKTGLPTHWPGVQATAQANRTSDNKLLGVVGGHISLRHPLTAHGHSIYVDPHHRGKGIGDELVRSAKPKKGATRVTVDGNRSHKGNAISMKYGAEGVKVNRHKEITSNMAANFRDQQRVHKSQAALERHHKAGGVRTVRISTLDGYRRAPGLRWNNTAYTAGLAQHLRQNGPPKSPVKVHLYRDRPFIDDGAHRMWASQMNGRKTIPVQVKRFDSNSPYSQTWVGGRIYDDHRTRRFRRELERTSNLSSHEVNRLATKTATGWKAKMNDRAAVRGEKRALKRKDVSKMVVPYALNPAPPKLPMSVIAKASWGPRLPVGLRKPAATDSYMQTRRMAGGILKPVRVKAVMR